MFRYADPMLTFFTVLLINVNLQQLFVRLLILVILVLFRFEDSVIMQQSSFVAIIKLTEMEVIVVGTIIFKVHLHYFCLASMLRFPN